MSQKRVGVIGYPIEHSISPAMHNAAFKALGMDDWLYDRIAIPPDILKLGLRELRDHGYVGVNVTIPHKQAAMTLVKPDEIAQAVGALNTIDFRTNTATNTDVQGFIDDLAAHGVDDLADRKVLIIGAGGAARAAVYGLAKAGARIVVINRDLEKASKMLSDLGVMPAIAPDWEYAAQWLFAMRGKTPLIVNCTPVGMYPKGGECPWPDEAWFPHDLIVYDMIYRPAKTRLIWKAENTHGKGYNGLGMLVRQGAAAFRLWTGVEPPLDVMMQAAQEAVEELA
jgi:shikimate dehydrogenase